MALIPWNGVRMQKANEKIRVNALFTKADGELFKYLAEQQETPGVSLGAVMRRLCSAGLMFESMIHRGVPVSTLPVAPLLPLQSESEPGESSIRGGESARPDSSEKSNDAQKSEDAVPLYTDQLASIPLGLDFD